MKKVILLSIALFSAVSCRDFLEHEPVEAISINTQLATKKGVLEALNGAYNKLRDNHFSEAAYTYGDLQSGNLKYPPNNTSGAISIPTRVDNLYQFDDQPSASKLKDYYTNSYQIINNLNLILEYVDRLTDASSSEINGIKAEALALRAFLHFQLFKYYGQNYSYTQDASHLGIVYNTAPLKVGVDFPERKTAAETFNLLEKDITEALSLVETQHAIPAGDRVNFMNPTAVKTLATEIALWKNDWAKAYQYAGEIITGSGLALTPQNELVSKWALPESIWYFANTAENETPVANLYNFKTATNRSSYVASEDVYTLYASNDLRKQLFEIQNLKTSITGGTQPNLPYYFTKKYKIQNFSLVYRLSLLYFIRAEAALHLGNTQQALQDVNAIRNRAGLASLTQVSMDIVMEEKRKEFVFENQYFFDLMRNHKNIIRNNGCISNNCSPSYPNNNFVLPIPQESVNINSNMKQNPGY